MTPRIKVLLVALVGLALFVAALFFECAVYERATYEGGLMALIGFMGPIAFHFGWYANPLALLAWGFSLVVGKKSAWFALFASGFATLLMLSAYVTLRHLTMLGENESESAGAFIRFGPGIYIWSLSILSAPVAATLSLRAATRA